MIGVKNFEGILGADIFKRPGFAAAALIQGEVFYCGADIIGPEIFLELL